MRTISDLPDSFAVLGEADGLVGRVGGYQVRLVDPRAREVRAAWVDQLCRRDAGAGAAVHIVATRRRVTRLGWPVAILELAVEEEGNPVERRWVAVYEFVHVAGAVVIRAAAGASFDEPWIETLLESARPDWRGDEVVALADLWRED